MGIQPLGTSSGGILKLLLFPSFCTSFRKTHLPHYFTWYFALFHTHIHIYIYIAPGQGQTTLGAIFYGSRKVLSLWHWLHVLKISLPSDFMHNFHDFIPVCCLGRDRQPIWAKMMSTERYHHFNLNLYTYFPDLINVYSPVQGQTTPWGQNFDVNKNILSLQSFVTRLKPEDHGPVSLTGVLRVC